MISAIEAKILTESTKDIENYLNVIERGIKDTASRGFYKTQADVRGIAKHIIDMIVAKLIINGYDVIYDNCNHTVNIDWG